jgi:hypothetical protein
LLSQKAEIRERGRFKPITFGGDLEKGKKKIGKM